MLRNVIGSYVCHTATPPKTQSFSQAARFLEGDAQDRPSRHSARILSQAWHNIEPLSFDLRDSPGAFMSARPY